MKRRSKVSAATAQKIAPKKSGLSIGETRGLVAPVPDRTHTVTLRLSGSWYLLWERLKTALPGISDAELLRQGLAMRMATAAQDANGEHPKAFIEYTDDSGKLCRVDLEEFVGIKTPGE
jgi:hypothetical protein